MLWIIIGDYHDGKTTRLVIEPFSEKYKNRGIWGNFTLKHPRYKKIGIEDLRKIPDNTLVLLDEMQNWFNSHETFSVTNEFLTDFIHQCDKSGIDVFGTTHRFHSLDIDFRVGCHRIIKCTRLGEKIDSRLEDKRDFRFETISTYSGKIIDKRILRYSKAIPYFTVFNTKERIPHHHQKERDLRFVMSHNPELGVKMLERIAKKIKKRFENGKILTHPNLIIELGRLGYGKAFEEEIYALLKE